MRCQINVTKSIFNYQINIERYSNLRPLNVTQELLAHLSERENKKYILEKITLYKMRNFVSRSTQRDTLARAHARGAV